MTKAEILDQIIDKKKEELEILKEFYKKIKKDRDFRYFQTIKDYFGGSNLTIEGTYIKDPKYSGTAFEICRPHPDYTYDKELITLRLSEDWKKGGFKDITTSVYSTSDNSNYELERLITVGEVANILLDYKDDILGELNAYTDKFAHEYDKAYKALKAQNKKDALEKMRKFQTNYDEENSQPECLSNAYRVVSQFSVNAAILKNSQAVRWQHNTNQLNVEEMKNLLMALPQIKEDINN